VTAVWGSTFVVVKDAVTVYPTLQFLALRFALAAAVILPPAIVGRRRSQFAHVPLRAMIRGGLLMGFFLGAGYVFQTFGLERTSPSNAGFITGMFVVLVPLLEALVWRRWVGSAAAVGAALAFVGLFLLSGGAAGMRLSGDGLVFLCAVSFAAHILATSRYAGRQDVMVLTAVQLGVVAVMCAALAVADSLLRPGAAPLALPSGGQVWFALVVTAVFASAVAFYIQTFAQRHASSSRTAVIMAMEPVFAGLFGYFLAGDRWSAVGWLGAGLILAGILTSELLPEGLGPRRTESAALSTASPLADARPKGESPEQPAVWALAQDGAVWLPHGRRPLNETVSAAADPVAPAETSDRG
jgi:drug/metabolite transporter (DMT)-like permease